MMKLFSLQKLSNDRLQSYLLWIALAGGGLYAACLAFAASLTWLSMVFAALVHSFRIFNLLQSVGTIAGCFALSALVLSILTARQ
jgi:hypothetical protein